MGYPDVSTTCNSIQLSIVENPSVGKDDGIPLAIQSVHFRFVETSIVPSVIGYVMSSAEESANRYKVPVWTYIENVVRRLGGFATSFRLDCMLRCLTQMLSTL